MNIGWNKNVAWSHTVSTAFRFTPYEYPLLGVLLHSTLKPATPTTAGGRSLADQLSQLAELRSTGGCFTEAEFTAAKSRLPT